MFYLSCENKGTDQLCSYYCTADLCLNLFPYRKNSLAVYMTKSDKTLFWIFHGKSDDHENVINFHFEKLYQ